MLDQDVTLVAKFTRQVPAGGLPVAYATAVASAASFAITRTQGALPLIVSAAATALLVFAIAVTWAEAIWLDTASGALTWRTAPLRRATVALGDVHDLTFRSCAGRVHLVLATSHGQRLLPLLSLHGRGSTQPAGTLTLLAHAIASSVPAGADVAAQLQAQAEHLLSGRKLDTSPLVLSHA